MKKEYILNYLTKNKSLMFKKYGITKLGLFGSYARDEATTKSDIDIAIELKKDKKTLNNFLSIKRELESIFNRIVDLGISPYFF